jgi:hypothetical protein
LGKEWAMQFDSNRAWREAMAAVGANREVLLALAGVFFLLPAMAGVLFLGDFQAQVMANIGNPQAVERLMEGMSGPVMGYGILSFLFQSVGYLAMLALLTDRARPTVGQALGIGLRALPTVIGAALLVFAGYLGGILLLAMLAAALSSVSGLAFVAVLLFLALLVGVVYVMVKFSLLLPVVVIDHVTNPVAALARSWRLTKGNSLRLFFFYLVLTIAYLVIAMVASIVIMAPAVLIAGQGMVSMLVGGLASGIIGAAASVVLIALLAAIHRQFAGPSPEALGSTFE